MGWICYENWKPTKIHNTKSYQPLATILHYTFLTLETKCGISSI